MKTIERSPAISSAGFTLIEVITVMVIIGILSSIAVPAYNNWLQKSRIESQVRTMAAEFSELRLQAITSKQRRSITLNANNYVFRSYTSDAVAPGTIIEGARSVTYPLLRFKGGATTAFSGQMFVINSLGLMSSTFSPPWEADDFLLIQNTVSATIDCIKLETARINVGKANFTRSTCDD